MTLVCFDTETTGLEIQQDHIIQLSLVKFDTGTWQTIDTRDWYILPAAPFTIPAEAEAVHHISKSFLLEHGVRLADIYQDLLAFTEGCDFLSYNGNGFDAPMLHYNLKRIGKDFPFDDRTWYDALLLERIHTSGQTDAGGEKLSNNLTSAYTRYYGHPFEGAHNSLDDVLATIQVFKAQVERHGWNWVQRDEFSFICYDRWLTRKGGYYFLAQGAHRGESIESMLRVDKSYLEWIVDKCKWTDEQTRAIIAPYLGRKTAPSGQPVISPQSSPKKSTPQPSRGKKKCKPSITSADLSLF